MITYTKKGYADQHVENRERVRMQILERNGWKRIEAPQEAPKVSPDLPDDFPAVDALRAAGLTTIDDVRNHDDLTTITGIGKATAGKINALIAE